MEYHRSPKGCVFAARRRMPGSGPTRFLIFKEIRIPQDVRDKLDLTEGDQLIVTVEDDRIVLTPTSLIPDDQAWFWTPEWQDKEAEVDEARARGERGTVFSGGDEFLAFLDADIADGH